MTIDPRNLDVIDWCDSMAFLLSSAMSPQKLLNSKQWKEWAHAVIQSPKIAQFRPPDPDGFSDWREWAIRFNQAVAL